MSFWLELASPTELNEEDHRRSSRRDGETIYYRCVSVPGYYESERVKDVCASVRVRGTDNGDNDVPWANYRGSISRRIRGQSLSGISTR